MDQDSLLDEFGKALISSVRDEAIEKHEAIMSNELNSQWANWMRENTRDFTPQQLEILRKIVIRSIDSTIHNFLWTFEEHEVFSITAELSTGETVNIAEVSDGLSGEMYTEDGWIARFSQFPEGFD